MRFVLLPRCGSDRDTVACSYLVCVEVLVNVQLASAGICPYPKNTNRQANRVIIDQWDQLPDGFLWLDLDVKAMPCDPDLNAARHWGCCSSVAAVVLLETATVVAEILYRVVLLKIAMVAV